MSNKDRTFEHATRAQFRAKTSERRKKLTGQVLVQTRASAPQRNDLVPMHEMVDRDIDRIRPAPRRSRRTSDAQLARVIRSVQQFGQVMPILLDEQDRIVAGHVVWEAMRELRADKIRCVVVTHLDEAGRRALAIALNRLGETGEWALDNLKVELDELEVDGIDLTITGFTLPELDIIRLADLEKGEAEGGDADHQPDDTLAPIAMPGDLFALGDHLILCGSALDPSSYRRLLGDEYAHYVFSDPPYNCEISGNVSGLGKHKHQDFAMAVGEMTDQQFEVFLYTYLELCQRHTVPGAVIAACMDWRQIDLLLQAGRSLNLHRLNIAVWNKGSGGMGGFLRSAHEMIVLFCTAPKPVRNNVALGKHGRDRTNVWNYPGANQRGSSAAKALEDHPTPKPVPLVVDALLDVTARGEIVLDPFMGSGTTLMAAEQCGRICRGIELDPKYVDVTIRRWEKLTGRVAERIEPDDEDEGDGDGGGELG